MPILAVISVITQTGCLRGYLKSDRFLAVFQELLCVTKYLNEISFVTARILSRMLDDGEDLWYHHAGCVDAPTPPVALAHSRAAIGEQIVAVIDRWDRNRTAVRTSFSGVTLPSLLSVIVRTTRCLLFLCDRLSLVGHVRVSVFGRLKAQQTNAP